MSEEATPEQIEANKIVLLTILNHLAKTSYTKIEYMEDNEINYSFWVHGHEDGPMWKIISKDLFEKTVRDLGKLMRENNEGSTEQGDVVCP